MILLRKKHMSKICWWNLRIKFENRLTDKKNQKYMILNKTIYYQNPQIELKVEILNKNAQT